MNFFLVHNVARCSRCVMKSFDWNAGIHVESTDILNFKRAELYCLSLVSK